MGCDGGTIPKRDELVRTKKKPEQVDKDAANTAKWRHCAHTQQELSQPIVSCELGRLFNKESILTYLLDKTQGTDKVTHIRNLKDVKTLNLTEDTAYLKRNGPNGADKGDQYVDRQDSRYICPIVGLEMNGKYKFCYLRGCGCVLSVKGMKEVKSEVCHKCAQPYTEDDVIILNGSPEDVSALETKMNERRALAKKIKEGKRKAKADNSVEDAKKIKLNGVKQEKPSTSTGQTNGVGPKPIDKTKPEYSIAKDPTASEAFKSLFTSHETCKNQPKPHWVTHNPCFY